ncbi:MAG: hypothetical protein KC417_00815 [Myxococcales bacterium]|nr:hypothetical protein [Myxococcales bacterium]
MGSHRRTASGRALSCALVFVVASALALAACGGSTPPGADSPKAGDRGAAKKAMPSPKPEYLSNDKRARRKPAGPAPETGDLGAWLDLEDPSGHALDAFHARLAATAQGEGKTRLLFFGASHVASDLFTRIVRSDLQREFGDGGRGWVLPVHAWRYYRPLGLSLESNGRRWKSRFVKISKPEPDFYGLAGVYMESTRAGDHGALTTHASATAADFELHYLAQPRGGDVDVFLDGKRLSRLRTKGAAKGVSSATFAVPAGEHRFEVRTVGNGPVRLFGV